MRHHALIIEDEVLIALEMESLLGELGFGSFEVADSPRDALESARRARPDLITADYRIIGGTGVEAVEAILAELGPIPVVYVTGNPDMVPGHGRPVVDKPIDGGALARACQSVCRTVN